MRRSAFVVIAFGLLIAAGCTGGDDGSSTSSVTPAANATAEPATTATTATTVESTTPTATAEPRPTEPPIPAPTPPPAPGDEFGVVKVHRNDEDGGLNLRAEAATIGSEILAVIPPAATGVRSTGNAIGIDDSTWLEVSYQGATGWVNALFLTRLPSFEDIGCGDPAAEYSSSPGAVPAVSAPEDPSADHVFSIHHTVGSDCERTVVTFGRDFSFDADFDQRLTPASGVPAGIALRNSLGAIEVVLPRAIIAAASTASESLRRDNGGADWLFVRPTNGGRFDILGFWDRNRGVRYFFLENPGRLVIDTIDAPTGTGIALGAVVSDGRFSLTVLPRPINIDASGPPPEPPFEVVAYSRPFEASATIRLRTVPAPGAAPGSGDPVIADWSGSTFSDSCGSRYAVTTTDYLEAWGVLSFTVEALAAGTYELFVGDVSEQDGRELGVYHVFTVGGSSVASC